MAPSSTTSALLPPYWKRAHTMTGEPILPPIPCPHISMFLSLCRLHIWTRPSVSCYSNLDTSVKIQWRMSQTTWASCQIRHIVGAHAPGMSGTFSPPPQVRDPDMHHGTCVTHVPWCMSGSLISGFLWSRRRGETFPALPAHAQATILRIW